MVPSPHLQVLTDQNYTTDDMKMFNICNIFMLSVTIPNHTIWQYAYRLSMIVSTAGSGAVDDNNLLSISVV